MLLTFREITRQRQMLDDLEEEMFRERMDIPVLSVNMNRRFEIAQGALVLIPPEKGKEHEPPRFFKPYVLTPSAGYGPVEAHSLDRHSVDLLDRATRALDAATKAADERIRARVDPDRGQMDPSEEPRMPDMTEQLAARAFKHTDRVRKQDK